MTQLTLNYTELESRAYNNILDEINKPSNIKDPRDPYRKRKFVYDFDPFDTGINFSQLPYIILELPVTEYLGKQSNNGDRKSIMFTHKITVRTAQEGANNSKNPDIGRTDMFTITNNLHETFNSLSVRNVLRNLNIHKPKLTKLSTDSVNIDGKYMYESVFELTYKTPYLITSA